MHEQFDCDGPCPICDSRLAIPKSLFDVACRNPKVSFYCAYGHALHFSAEAGRQRLESKALKNNVLRLVKNDDEKPA